MTIPTSTSAPSTEERDDSGSATLQRILFAPPTRIVGDGLYYHVHRGKATADRFSIRLGDHARVSTNTYFGRLPAAHLRRVTSVVGITLEAVVSGSGRLTLLDTDLSERPRIVDSVVVTGATDETVSLRGALTRHLDGGHFWAEFESDEGSLSVSDARFVADDEVAVRPVKVVICTFNRAADCLATITALVDDEDAFARVGTVYVVDQGTDPVADQPGFADVEARFGGRLRYIRQPNLGGAGGFTRGLFESIAVENDDADVILMDDDIVLEPDTVVRLTSTSARATRPILIGGQMLNLYHPTVLHTHAETVDLANLNAGIPVVDKWHNVDVRKHAATGWASAGYNAWWCCLIPAEVVRTIGFPLPVFFQWDDIEYGLRAAGRGFPTVTLPGAAVWHADFALKDWDDWSRYFSHRNSMIVSALHSEVPAKQIAATQAKAYARYILSMQYGMAATLTRAIEDYLAGPEQLHDGGAADAAVVRALRNQYPETIIRKPEEITREGALPPTPDLTGHGTPSKPVLVMGKRLVYRALGRSNAAATLPASANAWWNASRFSTVFITDASQNGFRVRRHDGDVSAGESKRAAQMVLRLVREGADARRRWREAVGELTSAENWRRIYGLD
ncbi:glycosyltransferase [Planctomonas deserti]|uniref:glycosyltransferase n=1 Tax=Planctomonas deserti TaxID=2144185 RepID=UPI000D3AB3CC|nr:glycosyltransferase [Planctomonas deserti]